jgi:hypothetical protein
MLYLYANMFNAEQFTENTINGEDTHDTPVHRPASGMKLKGAVLLDSI